MKKSVFLWQIAGFLFTAIFGTLLHFVYNWSGESILLAPFSAVSESIWEHMKLLYFPMLVFSFFENRYIGKENRVFWCAKLIGTVAGLLIIPMLYYTYTGAFDVYADWFNITIFFIAAAVSYVLSAHILKYKKDCIAPKAYFFALCAIAVLFVIFTFKTPQIPLFEDKLCGTYGVNSVWGRVAGTLHPV